MIVQVTDQRNIMPKYDVAVIKRTQDFSKDTYGQAYNKFSSFLAGNKDADSIEANATKEGYAVLSRPSLSNTEHNVVGVRSTRDAMRWIFNKDTKVGDVSPLYECGDNNHMLVVMLTGIHKRGYQPWDDEQVKSYLTSEVMKDKQAAILQEKMKDVKSFADVAKLPEVVTDTVKHVNFTSNAYISKIGNSEPALSGAVSTSKPGDFKAGIRGNGGVYAYQVLDQKKLDGQFDAKKENDQVLQSIKRTIGNVNSEMYEKAKVEDNRYLFY